MQNIIIACLAMILYLLFALALPFIVFEILNFFPNIVSTFEQIQLSKMHVWKNLHLELKLAGVSERYRRVTVERASKIAESDDFIKYILPLCYYKDLGFVLLNLAKRGKLKALNAVMHGPYWGIKKKSFALPRWYVCAVHFFVERGCWNHVEKILHSVFMNSLCHWVTQGGVGESDLVILAMINATRSVQLSKCVKEKSASKVRELSNCLNMTADLCEVLYMSLLDQVCVAMRSDGKKTTSETDSIHCHVQDIYKEIILFIYTISTSSVEGIMNHFRSEKCEIPTRLAALYNISSSRIHLFLCVMQQFNMYYVRRRGNGDDHSLLIVLSVLPLFSELQSVALRIMLRHKRWDVISHADLSGVWEQDRRHLLQAAVKQRQWSVVKKWANHTLYDDQRIWALNEALNEKQWDVALLLADHGLTDIDLMRVHYRLAKYADWGVILHMFERGADVAEVKERLGRMKDNKRIPESVICRIDDRRIQVRNLEKYIRMAKADTLKTACHRRKWISVLFALIRNPSKESVRCALKVAMKKKDWHVVMQLIRIGMDVNQRKSLFFRMMRKQQWSVCRVLLEQGLSVQLCLDVLPQLMEINQWTLVARVMEHDVGDDVRQQVMQRAWKKREGSVVWLCIKSLPTPLSVEERKALFQRAFSCELWQVIKPLVEEKDETGIRHRDTALLEAIERHEWDVVDHCQLHHADINMKDDNGHTPLQRAAMKKDWEAVKELVVRDGDPNLVDRGGNTVLHRVIAAHQWGIVNLLIQYQADIHKERRSRYGIKGVTPLGMLIDVRRMDLIKNTLFWCPDQSKGVNARTETPLHVACLSGYYDTMYYLLARGVNPLAVTEAGQSALVYAVLNKDGPQRMVAECIKLGFSTHQPKLTDIAWDLRSLMFYRRIDERFCSSLTSPVMCALLRGLPVVMQMLYESGACRQRELFMMYTVLLPKLADPNTHEGRHMQRKVGHHFDAFTNCALPNLIEIATTPRSLESTCRLVISHCLTLSKTRHRDVDKLPLPERMKNFVLFSDLTDPDFGKYMM